MPAGFPASRYSYSYKSVGSFSNRASAEGQQHVMKLGQGNTTALLTARREEKRNCAELKTPRLL